MPFNSNTKTNYFQWTSFLYKNKKINSLIYTISEYSKLHCQFVSKLPKNISYKDASILGCAVISGYSPVIKNKDIDSKSNIAIIGAGGLGLLALNAAKNSDCLITDTWFSMGSKKNKGLEKRFLPYQVNKKVFEVANKNAVFMHCLPAERQKEVSGEIIDNVNISLVWDEAENRLHIQKAILEWCLHKI